MSTSMLECNSTNALHMAMLLNFVLVGLITPNGAKQPLKSLKNGKAAQGAARTSGAKRAAGSCDFKVAERRL